MDSGQQHHQEVRPFEALIALLLLVASSYKSSLFLLSSPTTSCHPICDRKSKIEK